MIIWLRLDDILVFRSYVTENKPILSSRFGQEIMLRLYTSA